MRFRNNTIHSVHGLGARLLALQFALVFSMTACSKAADSPPKAGGPTLPDGRVPTALVTALDTNTMKKMEQRAGTWQEADATSEWRAMASGGLVRMIDETKHVGESGVWRVTHYFTDDGKLAAYYEFRIQTVTAGDRPPAKQFVLFKIEFQNDTVSHSEKTVDNVPKSIEPFEIENVRNHSMALLALAKSAPVTSPAKP